MTFSLPLPGGFGDSQAVLEDARQRTKRRRRRQAATAAGVGAIALGVSLYASFASGTESPPSGGSANAPAAAFHLVFSPAARLVDPNVVVPKLPDGLALDFDSHINSSSAPYSYSETIMYASAKSRKGANVPEEQLAISFSTESHPFSYNAASCGSTSGPNTRCVSTHLTIAGALAKAVSFPAGMGALFPSTAVVWWSPKPNVSLTLSRHGLSLASVEHIAQQLRLSAKATQCVANRTALHSGICAPGANRVSPPNVISPSVATMFAEDSVNSSEWKFYGAISSDRRRSWVEVSFGGKMASLIEPVPNADDVLTNTYKGHTFLMGMLPAATTRIVVPEGTNDALGIAPSSISVDGWRFFGVPVSAALKTNCNELYREGQGRVSPPSLPDATRVAYYRGTHLLGYLSACNNGIDFGKE